MALYRDAGDARYGGNLYIGQLYDDGWFHGSQLNQVLCNGSKAESWAFSPSQLSLTEIEDFWARYALIGRCAIDEAHDRHFVGDASRWLVEGDRRTCLWCGNHRERLRRWTEAVERERWEPAQGIETAAPPRRETGLARKGESPVVATSDDAPNPSGESQQ